MKSAVIEALKKVSLDDLLLLTNYYKIQNATLEDIADKIVSKQGRMLNGETEEERLAKEIEAFLRAEDEAEEERKREEARIERRVLRHLKKQRAEQRTAKQLKKISHKSELTPKQISDKYRAAKKKSRELETAEYNRKVRRHRDNPFAPTFQ